MGDYEDGFHNKLTIHAVANPVNDPKPGQFPDAWTCHRKATVTHRAVQQVDRTITLETCHVMPIPRIRKTGSQYTRWPITVCRRQLGRKAVAYLPTLKVSGMSDPWFR